MKTFKDIKIGDTVYVYGRLEPVQRFTVTYIDEFDINNPHNLYHIGYDNFGSKPKSYKDSVQSMCRLNDKSSTFGRYAATVYFNQEDVIKRFNEDIKTLERYKQDFINNTENHDTKKNKEQLLKDLCARLPYRVVVDYAHNAFDVHKGHYVKNGSCILTCYLLDVFISPRQNEQGEYIKPYLFPLSSMTEEQYDEFTDMGYSVTERGWSMANYHQIDWLNKNHFDYRGLIPMGLAIDATGLNIY